MIGILERIKYLKSVIIVVVKILLSSMSKIKDKSDTMLGNVWLSMLYYDVGRQQTSDMKVTYSTLNRDNDVIFRKWKLAIDVIGTDVEFSHRTILKNEIVIDLDPETVGEKVQAKVDSINIHLKLSAREFRHYVLFTGSKGYHIHIFDDKMFKMTKTERVKHRKSVIENMIKKYDPMLLAENHMISAEFVEHWKSGKLPEIMYSHGMSEYLVI